MHQICEIDFVFSLMCFNMDSMSLIYIMCFFFLRYNNQWMIVDYKFFKPGRTDITEQLFTVLEQIP